jgi:putative endonuclease
LDRAGAKDQGRDCWIPAFAGMTAEYVGRESAMSDKQFHVYIISNRIGGTLYIGVTSRLVQRIYEHREGLVEGFSKKYRLHRLVYFEPHATAENAISREKQMKEWRRSWKIELIERENPHWIDLYPSIATPAAVIPAKAGTQ